MPYCVRNRQEGNIGEYAGSRAKAEATAASHEVFEGLESTTRDFELFRIFEFYVHGSSQNTLTLRQA